MNLFYFTDTDLIHKIIIKDGLYINDENYGIKKELEILGLKVGDEEKSLISKFPNSTQQIQNQKKYFKEENGNYAISVRIEKYKGRIVYVLNHEKIIKIEIEFKY